MWQRVMTLVVGVLLAGGWLGAMPTEGADLFPTAPPPVEAPAVKHSLHHVQMVRTEEPPVIDGRLDDAAWARAAVVRPT